MLAVMAAWATWGWGSLPGERFSRGAASGQCSAKRYNFRLPVASRATGTREPLLLCRAKGASAAAR